MSDKLLDWAIYIAAQEELARELRRSLIISGGRVVETTEVRQFEDFNIPGVILKLAGIGTLSELLIKTTDKRFTLQVEVDGNTLYDENWDWFEEMSSIVDEITAFEEDGTYVLHLSDVKFSRYITASAQPYSGGKNTLDFVFYKLFKIAE